MARADYASAVEEIKSRCNIVDLISSSVELKRAGSNFQGLCPFHSEKTPSFTVSESKQFFHCFGCGESGDAISFVMKYFNLTFPEAVEKLAAEYGVEIQMSFPEKNRRKEGFYNINREAARFFFAALTAGPNKGWDYAHARGILPETVKTFGIGYADEEWHSLTGHLLEKGTAPADLADLGLSSEGKAQLYDKYRNRLIFPIINTRGKVIGFGGRAIDGENPKYLNSRESLVFQKKYNLYGLNTTRDSIVKEKSAIIVEGYMDLCSLWQAGIRNVAATLGTALTPEQARLLRRYTNNIILCYDSDAAGIAAALRGIDVLVEEGLEVKVLHIEDGKDPDDYIKAHGKAAFENLAANAKGHVDYRIGLARAKYDLGNTEQNLKFLREAAGILKKLSPVEADLYIKRIAAQSGVSEGALRREVSAGGVGGASPRASAVSVPQEGMHGSRRDSGGGADAAAARNLERQLLRIILHDGSYIEKLDEFPEAVFTTEGRALYEAAKDLYEEDPDANLLDIAEMLEDPEIEFMDSILKNIKLGADAEASFEDCRRNLLRRRDEKRKNEILDILSMAEDRDGEVIKSLMEEFSRIQAGQKKA